MKLRVSEWMRSFVQPFTVFLLHEVGKVHKLDFALLQKVVHISWFANTIEMKQKPLKRLLFSYPNMTSKKFDFWSHWTTKTKYMYLFIAPFYWETVYEQVILELWTNHRVMIIFFDVLTCAFKTAVHKQVITALVGYDCVITKAIVTNNVFRTRKQHWTVESVIWYALESGEIESTHDKQLPWLLIFASSPYVRSIWFEIFWKYGQKSYPWDHGNSRFADKSPTVIRLREAKSYNDEAFVMLWL